MRSGLTLVVVGILFGTVGVAVLTPLLRRFLLDVGPFDLFALGGAAVLMLAVSALASWLPARRAARIDPATTLQAE
jgi:ABC-type lipoprotein release transport system permease subunit